MPIQGFAIFLTKCADCLSNSQGGGNKQGGRAKVVKSINVEEGNCVRRGAKSEKNNK